MCNTCAHSHKIIFFSNYNYIGDTLTEAHKRKREGDQLRIFILSSELNHPSPNGVPLAMKCPVCTVNLISVEYSKSALLMT